MAKHEPLFQRLQERDFLPHLMLLSAAERALNHIAINGPIYDVGPPERATDVPLSPDDCCLTAMTLSALALEGLANAIMQRCISDWSDFDALNPYAKCRLLAEHFKIPFIEGKMPWATVRAMHKFRNSVAHAKPESVVESSTVTESQIDARRFNKPKSKLEKQLTAGNARGFISCVRDVLDVMYERMDEEQRLGMRYDGWVGTTTQLPPP